MMRWLLLPLLLAGCALPTMTRPDMRAYDADHYQCYREASSVQAGAVALPMYGPGGGAFVVSDASPGRPRPDLYRMCMRAKGYRESE